MRRHLFITSLCALSVGLCLGNQPAVCASTRLTRTTLIALLSYARPATLVSALFTLDAPEDFDYRVFTVRLNALEYDAVFTRRPTEDGTFRFDGIPPGLYTLSVSGEIEGVLYGIIAEELLLPVGELVTRPFYRIDPLE